MNLSTGDQVWELLSRQIEWQATQIAVEEMRERGVPMLTQPDPDLVGVAYLPERILGDGEPADYPPLLTTRTGQVLLVAGVLNWVASLPGGGKSWLVLLAARQVLQAGGRVAILDYDQPPARSWGERARALGGQRFAEALTDQTRSLLLPGNMIEPKHRAMIADWLSASEINLVAVDTAGAAGMPISGDNIDQWIVEHLDTYRQAGLGIVVTDHLPKSPAKRRETRGPIGSVMKLARADIALRLGGKPWGVNSDGYITAAVEKDKLGVFGVGVGEIVSVIRGTHRDGALGVVVDDSTAAPQDDRGGLTDTDLDDMICRTIEDHPDGINTTNLRILLPCGPKRLGKRLEELTEHQVITLTKRGKANLYTLPQ